MRNSVFTTHTPVPAGNESFETGLVRKYLSPWAERLGVEIDQVLALARTGRDGGGDFNLAALAVRTSRRVNGVSELHGRVAGEMWNHLLAENQGGRVEHITNGVHLPSWIGPETGELLRVPLGPDFADNLLDPGFADVFCIEHFTLFSLSTNLALS